MKLVDDEQEDHILLTVTDTGGGIPQETIEHVFEPFFTTKEVGKGTGLGLSVAYGIISAMHGTMSVRNSTEGACFSIGVPVSELATGNWPSQSQGHGMTAGKPAHILVVDDETLAADAMAGYSRARAIASVRRKTVTGHCAHTLPTRWTWL